MRRYDSGETLVKQNSPVQWIGFLIEGQAVLRFRDDRGNETPCGQLGPGDCVGVFALTHDGCSLLDAVCSRPTTCLMIGRKTFIERLERFPAVRDHLYKVALDRALQSFRVINGTAGPAGNKPPLLGPSAVEKAQDLIQRHYAEPLRLEDVARACGMSKYHFSRVFKLRSGHSFKGYLNQVRIAAAKRTMREKGVNVSEACFAVGFNDLSYFSRVFRASEGVPPSVFRRRLGEIKDR